MPLIMIIFCGLPGLNVIKSREGNIKTRYLLLTVVIGVSFLFTGCRTLKAPTAPSGEWIPPKWEKLTKTSDPVWQDIRGEKEDLSAPLTLNDLIDIALKNNPSTQRAWYEAKKAEALMNEKKGALYPEVNASGKVQRSKTTVRPDTDTVNSRSATMSMETSFLLLDMGGRSASIKAAKYVLLALNFEFNQSFQNLLLDVDTAYHEYYSARAEVDASEADVKDAKKTLDASEQKFKAGLVSKLDVLQAESNYADSLYLLEESKGNLKTRKADLAQILGLSSDTVFSVADPGDIALDIKGKDVSELIDTAFKKRPDIIAQRAVVESKKSLEWVAFSALWPELDVGASAGRSWQDSFGFEKLSKKDYEWTGFLSVKWDVFDGFAKYNKQRAARAVSGVELEKLRQAELEASADVWSKYYNLKTSIQKLTFSEAFFDSANASYDLSLEGYKAGLKDILDLLQSQSKLSEARSKLVQSRKDLYIAFAKLIHSTGSMQFGSQE